MYSNPRWLALQGQFMIPVYGGMASLWSVYGLSLSAHQYVNWGPEIYKVRFTTFIVRFTGLQSQIYKSSSQIYNFSSQIYKFFSQNYNFLWKTSLGLGFRPQSGEILKLSSISAPRKFDKLEQIW